MVVSETLQATLYSFNAVVVHAGFGRPISRVPVPVANPLLEGLQTRTLPIYAECGSRYNHCLEDREIQVLLEEIRACWGLANEWHPELKCQINCPAGGKGNAKFTPPWEMIRRRCALETSIPWPAPGWIVMCQESDCSALRHELVHMRQWCNWYRLTPALISGGECDPDFWQQLWQAPDLCLEQELEAYCEGSGSVACCRVQGGDAVESDVRYCCHNLCASCLSRFVENDLNWDGCLEYCKAKYAPKNGGIPEL